ncbi:hypothetical protein RUND412_000829 [Rhizina undulata]
MQITPLAQLLLLVVPATSQLLHPLLHPKPYEARLQASMSTTTDEPTGPPLLADVIPQDKSISIFSGFTRSVESVSNRYADKAVNSTVLAPSNLAISRLPRKPWEDPEDQAYNAEKYVGVAGEDRAGRNLRRFVEAHCVGVSPWENGEDKSVKTLEGKEVWWEEDGGVRKIMPDGIEVDHIKANALNGEIWVLKGVINYAE